MNKISVLHYMYMAGFVNDDGKWDSRPISQQEDNFKTFAELIVRECAKVAVHKPDGYVYTAADAGLVSAGRMTAAQLIKEHFGVE